MFRSVESDYRLYKGADSADLGYGPEVVDSYLVDYEAANGQQVGVFVAEPLSGSDRTIIMPQQHDYRNEPLSMRRAEILATNTHSRVALVETPGTVGLIFPDISNPNGYTVYGSTEPLKGGFQPLSQFKGALKGDFSEHAGIQLDAATSVLGLTEKDRLVVFGESMGAVTGAELTRHIGMRGLQLDALVLHETVNASGNKSIASLVPLLTRLGGIESDRRNQYFEENTAIGHPIKAFEQGSPAQKELDSARKSPKQQARAGISNGIGMRVGVEEKLFDTLGRFGKKRPAVLLSRGEDSSVAHRDDYEALYERLNDSGFDTSVWEFKDLDQNQEVGHFLLMSIARQAVQACQLYEFLDSKS